jgi:hypothetical protein
MHFATHKREARKGVRAHDEKNKLKKVKAPSAKEGKARLHTFSSLCCTTLEARF